MPGYDTLVSALEARFDYHSARSLATEAVKEAGLADRSEWSDDDLTAALAKVPADDKDLSPVRDYLAAQQADASAPAEGSEASEEGGSRKRSRSRATHAAA